MNWLGVSTIIIIYTLVFSKIVVVSCGLSQTTKFLLIITIMEIGICLKQV